ncbi:MAG: hypothetical protein JJV97_03180 [SAR324 cluster bacterium]|nr:hypothetical protein [SAR324 cluster bacterium]
MNSLTKEDKLLYERSSGWLNRAYRWLSKSGLTLSRLDLMLLANPSAKIKGISDIVKIADNRFELDDSSFWRAKDLLSWRFDSLLDETEFVVTDLESTGAVLGKDEIFEIGAIKMRGGEMIEEFHTYVKINQSIPPYVASMTRADLSAIAKAPNIKEVLKKFLEFLGVAVLVAHNAEFDYNFIYYETQRHGLKTLPVIDLCTWLLAKQVLDKEKKYGLTDLAKFHKGDLADRHSALGDARMTGYLLKYLISQMKKKNTNHLSQMLALENKSFNQAYKARPKIKRNKQKLTAQNV